MGTPSQSGSSPFSGSRPGAPMREVEESGLSSPNRGHDASGAQEHEQDAMSSRSTTGGTPLADRTVTDTTSTRPSTSDRPGMSRYDMPDKE